MARSWGVRMKSRNMLHRQRNTREWMSDADQIKRWILRVKTRERKSSCNTPPNTAMMSATAPGFKKLRNWSGTSAESWKVLELLPLFPSPHLHYPSLLCLSLVLHYYSPFSPSFTFFSLCLPPVIANEVSSLFHCFLPSGESILIYCIKATSAEKLTMFLKVGVCVVQSPDFVLLFFFCILVTCCVLF